MRMMIEVFIVEISGIQNNNLLEKCTHFIVQEYDRMQPLFKVVILLIINCLNFAQLFKYRKSFVNLPIDTRAKILKNWTKSNLTLKQDTIKLLLSFTILSYFDNEKVLEEFGINIKEYFRILCFYNSGISND
jgi:hypothetical protein